MPIRRELRWLYPIDWRELSRAIRFGRAGGRCEDCARPHGQVVACLPDGSWRDEAGAWRDGRGRRRPLPSPAALDRVRGTRVVLAAAHLDHDPAHNHPRNLRSLCQRCHMLHDRPHHLAQRWVTYRRRWAVGDLFLGVYDARTADAWMIALAAEAGPAASRAKADVLAAVTAGAEIAPAFWEARGLEGWTTEAARTSSVGAPSRAPMREFARAGNSHVPSPVLRDSMNG